jgi:hypothetical protein
MHVLISIDDTDSLESGSTGLVAQGLANAITEKGWGTCAKITRHQLLLDPRIPYTSHNSSMCFPAEIAADVLERVLDFCCTTLAAQSVPGSDPGLCLAVTERLQSPEAFIAFGHKAKKVILTKTEAYAQAERLGVHLSEHGGTGLGVIGALAGAGLRLTGNDGLFLGKPRIPKQQGKATVATIRTFGIDAVQSLEGTTLDDGDPVQIDEEWVKPVLLENRCVLLVEPNKTGDCTWKACGRDIYMRY